MNEQEKNRIPQNEDPIRISETPDTPAAPVKKRKRKRWPIMLVCLGGLLLLLGGAALYISRNIQDIAYSDVLYYVTLDGKRYGATGEARPFSQTAGEENVGEYLGEAQFEGETFEAYRYIPEDTERNLIILPNGWEIVYVPQPDNYRIVLDHGTFWRVPDPCEYVVFEFMEHAHDGSEDWLSKRMEQLSYMQLRDSEGPVEKLISDPDILNTFAGLLSGLPLQMGELSGKDTGACTQICVMLDDNTEFTLNWYPGSGLLKPDLYSYYLEDKPFWLLSEAQAAQLEQLITDETAAPEHDSSQQWLQAQLEEVTCLQLRRYQSPQTPIYDVLPVYRDIPAGQTLEEIISLLGSLPVHSNAELSQMYIDMFGDKLKSTGGSASVGTDGELAGNNIWVLHQEGRQNMRRLDFIKEDGKVVSVMYYPVLKALSCGKAAWFLTEEEMASINALLGLNA